MNTGWKDHTVIGPTLKANISMLSVGHDPRIIVLNFLLSDHIFLIKFVARGRQVQPK